MYLSAKFDEALAYAHVLHRNQLRKGTGIPYFAHLLAVTATVLDYGGDEDQAIAALLHDAVEDQGGSATQTEIERRFGPQVSSYVAALSDTDRDPKPPWLERKNKFLSRIESMPAEILLIAVADKLHNARMIRRDLEADGDTIWSRFKGKKTGTLWYYRSLLTAFEGRRPIPLLDEFREVVEDIETLVGG